MADPSSVRDLVHIYVLILLFCEVNLPIWQVENVMRIPVETMQQTYFRE